MTDDTKAVYLRGIDPETYKWLKVRAAQHERSMQAELRAMLEDLKKADEDGGESVGAWFRRRLDGTGGFDELEIPTRKGSTIRWADFSE
jgi:plasmid stability protein